MSDQTDLALGHPGAEVGRCWSCGRGLTSADYGRENRCLGCDRDTRVCRNCRHYAPGRANECYEPRSERILIKDRANFCDFFEPNAAPAGIKTPAQAAPDALRQAAEALFKS
ncbi:hypothetical protein ABC977_10380 [Thioalkalicoccus limnaeus]|uniref:Uncharacterized protein n=1 Tax=Thioalkalicoccus limnaeus TaxID=120681 RepID=A0ABV4BE67_9GAMM